jgi:c(7)-type cytochrome triheme protein
MALVPKSRFHSSLDRPKVIALAIAVVGVCCLALVLVAGDDTELRLPEDVVFDAAPSSPGAVTFRHESHVMFTDNRCMTCHPQPFSILGRHDTVSHDTMREGGSCGKCHNGEDASGTEDPDSCTGCHDVSGSDR